MSRRIIVASALSMAVGMALAVQAEPANAQGMGQGMGGGQMASSGMSPSGMQKCYGVNAAGKNDCRTATVRAHQAKARDVDAFVVLPAGDCMKIAGGKLKAG